VSRSHAMGQLRHLYSQMIKGVVLNPQGAALGLLGPAIEELEHADRAAAPPQPDAVDPGLEERCGECGGGGLVQDHDDEGTFYPACSKCSGTGRTPSGGIGTGLPP
jgi:hypothetical protein